MADSDERRLVEAAKRDPVRFAELYDRHFERVYAFVARRVRDRDAAEEVTADIREGFHTITPYIVVRDAPALLDFVARVFEAEETGRFMGAGLHAEVRIGDSMMMIGGGAPPERPYAGQEWPTSLHVYVADTDAAYARALHAGATSIDEPSDRPYGERSASIRDPLGNRWYIATTIGDRPLPSAVQTVTVSLHPERAEPVIAFLTRAFGATDVETHASPEGVVFYATVKIGDSIIEMGEARGPYQPMPTRFYVYVPDCDALYRSALAAGATSIAEPADQPYGDRIAGVADPFGNQWHLATRLAR
jgi:uncharacterized glyoxalase superfamily protein PhnB